MATQAPKSILKKKYYPATTSSKADRNRELAVQHAQLLQQRKDVELEILLSTETLIDFPLAPLPHSASNPSTADAKAFKDLLRLFQPSDYDALILERNIDNRCGYTLCSNPKVKQTGGGDYRIVNKTGKAADFRVVQKQELEKWCSDACAKRALYVRVQLSESPAWEREASQSTITIDLIDEPRSDESSAVKGMANIQPENSGGLTKQDGENLALERGDRGLAAENGLVDVMIREKDVGPAEPPSLGDGDLSEIMGSTHLNLDGYTPRFSNKERF